MLICTCFCWNIWLLRCLCVIQAHNFLFNFFLWVDSEKNFFFQIIVVKLLKYWDGLFFSYFFLAEQCYFQIYWWIFILGNIKVWSNIRKNAIENWRHITIMIYNMTLVNPLSEKNGFIVIQKNFFYLWHFSDSSCYSIPILFILNFFVVHWLT